MAELYVLGQIYGTSNFVTTTKSLFCRYSLQSGPNWTLITGYSEGQTATNSPLYDGCVWAHPLDLHYVTKGIQGWPKIFLEINCLDSLGRYWVVGYTSYSIPAVPGHHELELPCWVPAPTTIRDKIKQYFLGGSHQLLQPDIFSLGTDRFKLKTQSTGTVILQLDVIVRNFSNFGVEYK